MRTKVTEQEAEMNRYFNKVILPGCPGVDQLLVTKCWDMLEPQVKQQYSSPPREIDIDPDSNLHVSGLSTFIRNMRDLQKKYGPNEIAKAVEDFREFGQYQHSTKPPLLFAVEATNSLEPYASMNQIRPILHNIKTGEPQEQLHLSEMSEEGIQNIRMAEQVVIKKTTNLSDMTNEILTGLLTQKIGHTRSPNPKYINENGWVNRHLLKEVALYIENNSKIMNEAKLDKAELKFIGARLAEACNKLDLSASNDKISVSKQVHEALAKVDLPKEIKMAKAVSQTKTAETLYRKVMNESDKIIKTSIEKVKKTILASR